MFLNAWLSIIILKIFPGNLPLTCNEHVKKVHFLQKKHAKRSTLFQKCAQKCPLSPNKHAKRSTFSQNSRKKSPLSPKKNAEKVHFFPKYTQKSPLSPRKHAKKTNFARKAPPPQIQTWLRACDIPFCSNKILFSWAKAVKLLVL